ncbi:hypothetical protein [Azospirillum picis]|uniref:Uncharacterized protein n=1 Tax=Azospirillum picis TaxID=488438 RepID=A0ABU0MN93_9PROT|nr:hypothetical protein [Azospirillum picis]MBP2303554.1 hypothetical protein [Azospirillum picis]MDQ0534940.1 hypothetical protein [Azospirillum picis]
MSGTSLSVLLDTRSINTLAVDPSGQAFNILTKSPYTFVIIPQIREELEAGPSYINKIFQKWYGDSLSAGKVYTPKFEIDTSGMSSTQLGDEAIRQYAISNNEKYLVRILIDDSKFTENEYTKTNRFEPGALAKRG